jgi:hypothetical protein
MPKHNPYVRSWNVPSSEGGEPWKVSERIDGTYACACPKWKFHPAPKVDCHHIDAVIAHPNLYLAAAVARAIGSAAACPRIDRAAESPRRPAQFAGVEGSTDLETALREAKGQAC